MNRDKYHKYLLSEEWRQKRQFVFEHQGKICKRCGKTNDLHVHHKTYKNLFSEPLCDLIVLCSLCHRAEHRLLKLKLKENKKINKKRKKESKRQKSNSDYIKKYTKPKSRFKSKTTSVKYVELIDGTKVKPSYQKLKKIK